MSLKLVGQVSELLLGRCEKAVLRELCDSADDVPNEAGRGINCFPSIETVAWKSDYSRSATKLAIQNLETAQILVAVGVHPTFGTTQFDIYLAKASKKPPLDRKIRRQGGGRISLLKKKRRSVSDPLDSRLTDPLGSTNTTTPEAVLVPPMVVKNTAARQSEINERGGQKLTPTLSYVPSPLPLPPTPLASEGGQPKERKLTRRERRRLETSIAVPELRTFTTAICEFSNPPHEWLLRDPVSAGVQPRLACPDFRSHLKGVSS